MHQENPLRIIITPDSNQCKTGPLKSSRINKKYIFTLGVWKCECTIQENTEKGRRTLHRTVAFGDMHRRSELSYKGRTFQKLRTCVIHTLCSPFWRVSWLGPDVILTHPFVLKLSSACGGSIQSSPSSMSAAGEGDLTEELSPGYVNPVATEREWGRANQTGRERDQGPPSNQGRLCRFSQVATADMRGFGRKPDQSQWICQTQRYKQVAKGRRSAAFYFM